MREMSRRNFFSSFISKFAVQNNATDYVEKKSDCDVTHNTMQTVVLGPISLFPVNTNSKINLLNQSFILHSFPEGIRLCDEINKSVTKLSLGPDGQLYAHIGEHWSDSPVLSLFTGEIYNI